MAESSAHHALPDEAFAILSHDLRNALSNISLNAALLARRGDNEQLAAIRSSLKRADRVIEDLLTAAAVDDGGVALLREPEDVRAILDELGEIYDAPARDRGIALTLSAPDLPSLELDRGRVLQLLSLLVDRALAVTPSDGRVIVDARRVGGDLVLSVGDGGPAPSGEARRDWVAARVRGARSGTAFGFHLVEGLVKAHGGRLVVGALADGAPGARWEVRIPISAA